MRTRWPAYEKSRLCKNKKISTPTAIKAVLLLVKLQVLVFDVGDHTWRLPAGVVGIVSYLWLS